jgi:hypothetical protein
MTDPMLQMNLPAYLIMAVWLIVFWQSFRKAIRLKSNGEQKNLDSYNRLRKVGLFFWIILIIFSVMIVIYSALPSAYYVFIPLEQFNHPIINVLGLLILKISIVWIVVAQLHIDKEVFKFYRNIENLGALELLKYSEKMLLSGIVILFLGIVVTITNIVGLFLFFLGLSFYFWTFRHFNISIK